MLLRSTFGILAFAALLSSASASLVTYRVSGTFTEATEDYEPLKDTAFSYEFSFDTDATRGGDENWAYYDLQSTDLKTAMGDLKTSLGDPNGLGMAEIDLDPTYGSMTFGAYAQDEFFNQHVYGLIFPDLDPQTGELPVNLVDFATSHKGTFLLTGYGPPRLNGIGTASSNLFKVERVQSVPEPASMAALGAGALALARRRRVRQRA